MKDDGFMAASSLSVDENKADCSVNSGVLAFFTGPSLPLGALGIPLVVSLPEFYANYVGVKLAVVGLVFMLVRLADLGVDPLLGVIMDATRTRFGRYRPWMALGAPLLMLGAYMTFMARPGAGPYYLAAWLFVVYFAYSVLVLGQVAWGSTLATGYNQRSRIYGWVQNGAMIGMVLVLFLPPVIGPLIPQDRAAGVQAMGWFIVLLAPLTVGLAIWRTPEPEARRPKTQHVDLKAVLKLLSRPAVTRILFTDLSLALAPGITGALFIFFFREARGFTTTQSTTLLLIYFLGALAGAPLWVWLSRRIGKHRALIVAAVHYSLMMCLLLLLPKGEFFIAAPFIFITGFAYPAGTMLLRAMMADAADEADFDGDGERTGLLFAMLTSTQKVGFALSIGLTFPILQAVGFIATAGAHNTPFAIRGLEMVFVIAPISFALMGALMLRGYHLDEKTHGVIRMKLTARQFMKAPSI